MDITLLRRAIYVTTAQLIYVNCTYARSAPYPFKRELY